MKVCTKCNIQYPEDKKFCKKCGELLKFDDPIETSNIKSEINSSKQTLVQEKRSSKRLLIKTIIIGASVIVFVIITIFIIIYLKQKSAWNDAKEKNSINSFQAYINDYPNGRYVEEAKSILKAKDDSIANVQMIVAIHDSIINAHKSLDNGQGIKIIIGTWKGTFNKKMMELVVNSAIDNTVAGYDVLNGKKRPFTGSYYENGNSYSLTLNEPGDDNGDGKFEMSIDKSSNIITGYWKQFKGSLKYNFIFNKISNSDVNQDQKVNKNENDRKYGLYPQASEKLLYASDLRGLSKYDLKIMRNEIFARHGYIFKTPDMISYFKKQSWYQGQYNDVTSMLTIIEKKNIELIKKYE